MALINIKTDFSAVPIGRYPVDSDVSGEKFRKELLKPKLNKLGDGEKLRIDLNGVAGYGSSFLEEAFGGLVRAEGFSGQDLHDKLEILADEVYEMYSELIWEYIDDADAA